MQTELDIARAIRDGELPSPKKYENFHFFDLRITGTGLSKRDNPEEWVYRPSRNFLTDEFLERCQGLPVIFQHPDDSVLSQDEYRERAIGTIMLPYIKGDEVWGIAKIYDDDAAHLMSESKDISTSPGVLVEGEYQEDFEDGLPLLIEGVPRLADHLAICTPGGVWDKGGPPTGIRRE